MKPFIRTALIYFSVVIVAGLFAYFADLTADQTVDMAMIGLLINVIYDQQKAR